MTIKKSAKERFEAFHAGNPHVYQELRGLAREVQGRGYRKFGIRPLWERLRWKNMFEVTDPDSIYKLNDHYKEFYSRMLMEEAEFTDFFTKRRSRADGAA